MASFLEDLLKKMQTAPHVGIPPVTNPKVPTKVERDAAEFAARQQATPKQDYGSGSSFDQLMKSIANSQHPTMRFGDPAFGNNGQDISEADFEKWDDLCVNFIEKKNADKAKRKHKSNNTLSVQDEQ